MIEEIGKQEGGKHNKKTPRQFDCDERREAFFISIDKLSNHNQMCSLMMNE